MKKFSLALLFSACAAAGAFAWDVGGGIMIGTGSYDRYSYYTDNWSTYYYDDVKYTGLGAYGFCGWKYADISLGFLFKPGDYKESDDYYNSWNKSYGLIGFQGGVYLKYPFLLSRYIRLYPTAGADIELQGPFSSSDEGAAVEFWLRFGIGADWNFRGAMFLRGNVLYGLGLLADDGPGQGFMFKAAVGWML